MFPGNKLEKCYRKQAESHTTSLAEEDLKGQQSSSCAGVTNAITGRY